MRQSALCARDSKRIAATKWNKIKHMRQVFNLRLLVALLSGVVALVVSSCDKQPNNNTTIEGYTEIECKAGEKPQFTFTAGGSWQLSSDKMWCTFITPAGNQMEMAGAAGTHTITLSISDKNISNSVTTANITIKVGDKSAVIAVVKRAPKEQIIFVENAIESRTNTFELGYVDWKEFRIKANFSFTAIEIPEWVEIAYKGEDGTYQINNSIVGSGSGTDEDALVGYARIVNDGERECHKITKENGYEIVFVDESGEKEFRFPVTYDGMGHDKLTFTGPTPRTYGWEVSLDGKTFRQYDEVNDTTTTIDQALEFSIAAQDKNYNVIFLEQTFDRGISIYDHVGTTTSQATPSECWMHFDLETATLAIDESTSTRYGVVMALPIGVYNSISSDIEGSILSVDGASGIDLPYISDDYQQYVICEFTQRDFSEREAYDGVYVYHSLTTIEILAKVYDNSSSIETYGAEEIFICPFVNSVAGKKPGIVVDPRIENWTTLQFDEGIATAEVYHKGAKLKISDDEYYLGENKDENMALYLWGPKDGWQNENVYILFKVDGIAKKLLVVTPPVM